MENKNSITIKDKIAALTILLLGYCIIKFILSDGLGLPATIILLLINLTFIGYQVTNKINITLDGVFLYTVNTLLSVSLSIYSFEVIKILTVLLLFVLIPCTAYFAFRHSNGNDPFFFFEILQALFIYPFKKFGNLFICLFSRQNRTKNLWKALLGLLISFPFATAIILILVSGDNAFAELFDFLFSDFFDNLFIEIFNILISLPLGCAIFSMLCCASTNNKEIVPSEEMCNRLCKQVAFVPQITSVFFVVPICLIYIVYFISQSAYFLSGFNGILPGEFTYSEYARQGFYELCIVCFINLAIIVAISIFSKKTNKKIQAGRILTIILSLITEVLIAIAMSKMLLYINEYGLTRLRVFVIWFLILLALIFGILLLKQFIIKVMLLKSCAVIIITMVCVLSYFNMDAKIAKYNYDNYKNGKLGELDVYMLASLSDDAIPYIIEIDSAYIKEEIKERAMIIEDNNDHWSMNLQTYKAKELLVNSK